MREPISTEAPDAPKFEPTTVMRWPPFLLQSTMDSGSWLGLATQPNNASIVGRAYETIGAGRDTWPRQTTTMDCKKPTPGGSTQERDERDCDQMESVINVTLTHSYRHQCGLGWEHSFSYQRGHEHAWLCEVQAIDSDANASSSWAAANKA